MDERDGVPQIDASGAHELVGEGALLLDVREDDEWTAGHAPEASHVPMAQVPAATGELPAGEIVVVCRSGSRSQRVAAFLRAQGFTASNLAGGMQAWAASGLPVVSEQGAPGTVI
jgi:rhodanese-related sulfurtransferase